MGGSTVCVRGLLFCFKVWLSKQALGRETILGSWVPGHGPSEVPRYKDLGEGPGSVLLSDPGHHSGNHEDPTGGLRVCWMLPGTAWSELLPSGPWPRLSVTAALSPWISSRKKQYA